MASAPLPRAGHSRESRGRYDPLGSLRSTDPQPTTENGVDVHTSPHNRRPYGVCATCNTEIVPVDRRTTEVVCPECDTLVPIMSGRGIHRGTSGTGGARGA